MRNEKKLSRNEFWKGITNLLTLIRGLDTSSMVFHSSTAKHLLNNSYESRNENSEKVTNDVDLWVDRNLLQQIENALKTNNISYELKQEDKPLIHNKIALNLKFNYMGVEYDIWTIEGKFDVDSPIGLSKDSIVEIDVSGFGSVKALSTEANNRFMAYLANMGDKKERTPV